MRKRPAGKSESKLILKRPLLVGKTCIGIAGMHHRRCHPHLEGVDPAAVYSNDFDLVTLITIVYVDLVYTYLNMNVVTIRSHKAVSGQL